MRMWEIAGEARGGDAYAERDEEMRRELNRAYKEGCREGYEKAMQEMQGRYGERGGYGERDGGYGERDGGYSERRGVKYTGPYSRYR